jgi:hypothetical protein
MDALDGDLDSQRWDYYPTRGGRICENDFSHEGAREKSKCSDGLPIRHNYAVHPSLPASPDESTILI